MEEMQEEKAGLIIGPAGPVTVELRRARPLHSPAIRLGHANVITIILVGQPAQASSWMSRPHFISQTHWKAVGSMRRGLPMWGPSARVCVHTASAPWLDESGPIRWAVTPPTKQLGSGPIARRRKLSVWETHPKSQTMGGKWD